MLSDAVSATPPPSGSNHLYFLHPCHQTSQSPALVRNAGSYDETTTRIISTAHTPERSSSNGVEAKSRARSAVGAVDRTVSSLTSFLISPPRCSQVEGNLLRPVCVVAMLTVCALSPRFDATSLFLANHARYVCHCSERNYIHLETPPAPWMCCTLSEWYGVFPLAVSVGISSMSSYRELGHRAGD